MFVSEPRAIAPRPAEGETKKDEKDDPKKKQGKKKGTRTTKKNAAENSESKGRFYEHQCSCDVCNEFMGQSYLITVDKTQFQQKK